MNSQYRTHPICKVCDRGALIKKMVFRMSGPVVTIGFIFLIPSFLGILVSAILAALVLFGPLLGIVLGAPDFITATIIFVAVPSFVGGLLGWLLIMKKSVLQCSDCGATVSAS